MRLGIVLLIGGCGRVAFDPVPAVDVAIDAPVWSAPELVLDEAGNSISNPSLSEDELEMFIIHRIGGPGVQGDIEVTTRATRSDPWGPLQAVSALNTGNDESGEHLSRDGLVMWFSSSRAGTLGGHDIYRTTRPTRQSAWTAPVHVTDLSSAQEDSSPATDDELEILLNIGGFPRDLVASRRASTADMFPTPQLVTELDTPDNDAGPELMPGSLTMYFMSSRPGGLGGDDIWMTRRSDRDSPWEPPVWIPELASAGTDGVPWVSSDEHVIYISSDRSGFSAIYRSSR